MLIGFGFLVILFQFRWGLIHLKGSLAAQFHTSFGCYISELRRISTIDCNLSMLQVSLRDTETLCAAVVGRFGSRSDPTTLAFGLFDPLFGDGFELWWFFAFGFTEVERFDSVDGSR